MVFRTTISLPWTLDRVFDGLMDPATMRRVAFPLVTFQPLVPSRFPRRWEAGKTYRLGMYLMGLVPLGWQELTIGSRNDGARAALTDVGPGFPVRFWNHRIALTRQDESRTLYEEELELRAGAFAPMTWPAMRILFAWRKRRWISMTRP